MKNNIQVDPSHYESGYDTFQRFISYYFQNLFIMENMPNKVLEIGIGNGFLNYLLKKQNVNVKTYDIDARLKPDFVGDISNIKHISESFNIVCAFEVLEHIPFEHFEQSLVNLLHLSIDKVLISLPYANESLEILININFLNIKKLLRVPMRIPHFRSIVNIKENKEGHFWELGTSTQSINKIKNIIEKHAIIDKIFIPPLNPYHCFFILSKRKL